MYPSRNGSCGPDKTPLERKGVHMKKLLTVFLALAFLVGTVGCPKGDKAKEKEKAKPAPTETEKEKPKAS
jgi:hypothetical protein